MLRKLFLFGNIALLLTLLIAVAMDTLRPWKPIQRKYRQMQVDAESDAMIKKQISKRSIKVKQILVDEFKETDRCITCHQGMDPLATPSMENNFSEHPFKSHPPEFFKDHPIETYGCTVCHGGQGLATTFIGAAHTPKNEEQKMSWKKKFGWEPAEHWDSPMLTAPYIQASCVKCHGNFQEMPYTQVAAKGKKLMSEHGCLGCHQWHGEGGPISVDLAEETANKPLGRIDFSHTGLAKEDMTLLNWIRLHFIKDPAEMTPGDPHGHFNAEPIAPSGMPPFNEELTEDDATALTTYILSANNQNIPHRYFVAGKAEPTFADMKFPSNVEAGKWVFNKYGCAGCHGIGGKQGRRNYNYTGGFEPTISKTVATYTREELRHKIEQGVPVVGKEDPKGPTPPLYMPPWKDKIKGKEMEALLDYLFSIAEKTQGDW